MKSLNLAEQQTEQAKIDEYCRKEKEILRDIPIQFHAHFSYLAYEHGHAYGYDEVLKHLEDFISGFNKCLKEYDDAKVKSSS